MGFTYVIEHMEDDEESPRSIPPWVELEYAHMRILAGEPARLYFTRLSKPSRASHLRPQMTGRWRKPLASILGCMR